MRESDRERRRKEREREQEREGGNECALHKNTTTCIHMSVRTGER